MTHMHKDILSGESRVNGYVFKVIKIVRLIDKNKYTHWPYSHPFVCS